MFKNILKILTVFILNLPFIYAHCPLCTVAAGAGVGITRFYGVDDIIVGLWIGAFIISTALWFNRTLKKEYVKFQEMVIIVVALFITIIPFSYAGLINHMNMFLGIDKLLFGIILGNIVTYLGVFISDIIKKKNKKKGVLFPYQTIVFILLSLIILSLLFWLIL